MSFWLLATSVAHVSRLLLHLSGLVSDCASRRDVGRSTEKVMIALVVPRYHPPVRPWKSATGEPAEPRHAGNLLFRRRRLLVTCQTVAVHSEPGAGAGTIRLLGF